MRFFAPASRRAFTLVELLIVLAIIALIAGLLFPVFASVRRVAIRTSCLSNFRNAALGTLAYAADYDDVLPPSNHRPAMPPDPVLDRTWPQLLLPYVRDFRVFVCPADPTSMAFGGDFDPDLLPGDYGARYYTASLDSDLGYNAAYLSPVLWNAGAWTAIPLGLSLARDPSRTLLYVESVGTDGAGSYTVVPPCRYLSGPAGRVDTFLPPGAPGGTVATNGSVVYAPVAGWNPQSTNPALRYGGVSLRHGDRLNYARLDGSVASTAISPMSQGCELQPAWAGPITDLAKYLWSPG